MATVGHIAPNFGVKKFGTEKEAKEFLRKFGFETISRRSDYDVWETKRKPKKRALLYESKQGLFIVAQIIASGRP